MRETRLAAGVFAVLDDDQITEALCVVAFVSMNHRLEIDIRRHRRETRGRDAERGLPGFSILLVVFVGDVSFI